MTVHYHVSEFTPGYVPDSDDPTFFTSRKDAQRDAVALVQQNREADWGQPRPDRRSWSKLFDEGLNALLAVELNQLQRGIPFTMASWYGVRPEPTHDLGRKVNLLACMAADCQTEFEAWAR